MKTLLTLILFFFFQVGYCQQERSFIDSVKPNIIYTVIKTVSSDLFSKIKFKKLYCQVDIKQRMISGDGIGYNPEFQDTIYTIDTMQLDLLSKKLKNSLKRITLETLHQADLGKINRRNFIGVNVELDKGNNYLNTKPKERLYINIKEPIDGWDVIQVIYNNFLKKRYESEINPCLTSNLYLPVIISYVEREGKVINQYFLYNYAVGISSKEGFYYKYIAKTKLNVCN